MRQLLEKSPQEMIFYEAIQPIPIFMKDSAKDFFPSSFPLQNRVNSPEWNRVPM